MINQVNSNTQSTLGQQHSEAAARITEFSKSRNGPETSDSNAASTAHGSAVIVTLSEDISAKQNGDARQAGQPEQDLSQAFREHGFLEPDLKVVE